MKIFKFKNFKKGMTFVELVVVIGIFAAISGTVLFNYRDFSSGVRLQNLTQEIALLAKRAQTFSSQGRTPILSNAQITSDLNHVPPDWVSSYGIAFNLSNDPKSFDFYFNSFENYEDTYNPLEENLEILNQSRNLFYDDFAFINNAICGSAESECLDRINITDGSSISMICINSEPVSDPDCNEGVQADKLHVSFTRPFLESGIYFQLTTEFPEIASHAFIKVSSSSGEANRYVTFWSTGQISVN